MDIWSLLMCGYMPPDVAWAVKAMDWASEPMFYKFAWVVVAIWKLVGVRGFDADIHLFVFIGILQFNKVNVPLNIPSKINRLMGSNPLSLSEPLSKYRLPPPGGSRKGTSGPSYGPTGAWPLPGLSALPSDTGSWSRSTQ